MVVFVVETKPRIGYLSWYFFEPQVLPLHRVHDDEVVEQQQVALELLP